MKLPRDLSGRDLGKLLVVLGYELTNQHGSHMRFTTQHSGEHNVTIPDHAALRPGTLGAVINQIAAHHGLSKKELIRLLFGE